MNKYECMVCGYVYDEALGIPEEGIAPGTKWEDLPADWACPLCGATKDEFEKQGGSEAATNPVTTIEPVGDMQELSALEISALCSNLAKGCEKQYKAEESALFTELSEYFKAAATPASDPHVSALVTLVEKDLESGLPTAKNISTQAHDRGAMRSLVWSEKVTRILKSLLARFEKEGPAMLENTGVYVCTICGFISIGDEPPALCPICKVPSWKFEKIEGGRSND